MIEIELNIDFEFIRSVIDQSTNEIPSCLCLCISISLCSNGVQGRKCCNDN